MLCLHMNGVSIQLREVFNGGIPTMSTCRVLFVHIIVIQVICLKIHNEMNNTRKATFYIKKN